MAKYADCLPYHSVFIDCTTADIINAIKTCIFKPPMSRENIISELKSLIEQNRHCLPTLSVRTALDLFLSTKNYPPKSEIIMSAINIPNMADIVRQHGLKIVPIDIDQQTASPDFYLIKELINSNTRAILVAHVFGKILDMDQVVSIGKTYNLDIIEDCAECFLSLSDTGHPNSDISMFSFGTIKSYTSFGGSLVFVRDKSVYEHLEYLQTQLPTQSTSVYCKKLVKGLICILSLNNTSAIRPAMYILKRLNINYQKQVVNLLRGFPEGWLAGIRQQAPDALFYMMYARLKEWKSDSMLQTKLKGDYISKRLNSLPLQLVGSNSYLNHYWLYPVIVENSDNVITKMAKFGIDAYKGATQLNYITNSDTDEDILTCRKYIARQPKMAKKIIDQVIYLPVHKNVPYKDLDRIVKDLGRVLKLTLIESKL